MKNAVVVVAIGIPELLKINLISFETYCRNTNSDLVIIDKPIYNIISTFNNKQVYPFMGEYNYLKFEKNQIYYTLDKYDRVLRLDADVVINPNTPNLFNFDDRYIYAVREDVNSAQAQRQTEITRIKKDLGDIIRWNEYYFNGGVVLASKQHKEVFNISNINFNLDLGILKEQNVFNWRVRKLNLNIVDLGPNFNYFKGIVPTDFYTDDIRRQAHFIHHTVQGTTNKLNFVTKDVNYFFKKSSVI